MSYNVRQNAASNNNYTDGRDFAVQGVVIHHAATTDFDGIGRTFQNPSRRASAHYGVGSSNNVDQYVSEEDTAWHAGDWTANQRYIGIENVNASGAPEWAIADSTFATLVELIRDIFNRHGLGKVAVGKNLFGHKDFNSTACPGQLYKRLQEIADAVNGGTSTPAPKPAQGTLDQVLEIGSHFVFPKAYRVDDIAQVGGIWQVKSNELCPDGFTWDENGIPVMPLVEVGGNTDQVLYPGDTYEIPGTYTVLNIGQYKNIWLAQVDISGWKLWVDVTTLTEV